MDIMRYAVVETATNTVVNVIEADSSFEVPAGRQKVASDTANPGDSYDGRIFTMPESTPAEPTIKERYAAAVDTDNKLEIIAGELGLLSDV